MPDDVGAELSQGEDRERRRADAVDVVVAVDADPLTAVDRRAEPLDGRGHVTEQERVVRDRLGLEERARGVRLVAAPAHEHGRVTVSETPSSAVRARTLGDRHGLDRPASSMQPR